MKTNRLLLVVVFLISGLMTKVEAQTSATVTGTTAGAKLIIPMSLTQTSALHFGTINLLSGASGTVVLPSNNTTRSFTGGVSASAVAPLATNAAYNVTGTKNVTYALTLPSTITVTETIDGTATMTISDLKARFNGASDDAVTSTLSPTGTDSFKLGGTLTVANSQAGGIYAGTFNVSVDYN
ncbi:DUF4402 domain-containing protein [Flavobacterium sp. NG2]|uniref:DUF4402 domain-containing protein n=1 Tax=Flavobacterium sp. NG2 TaxID=3097547 RepID=UPI002A809168|nr:DUF4402 domain-containing protein [Flavobacterium sp. NG2]WPR71438.1 DUF4402 domain-containing protein [Flavobacterium sp. NG2]